MCKSCETSHSCWIGCAHFQFSICLYFYRLAKRLLFHCRYCSLFFYWGSLFLEVLAFSINEICTAICSLHAMLAYVHNRSNLGMDGELKFPPWNLPIRDEERTWLSMLGWRISALNGSSDHISSKFGGSTSGIRSHFSRLFHHQLPYNDRLPYSQPKMFWRNGVWPSNISWPRLLKYTYIDGKIIAGVLWLSLYSRLCTIEEGIVQPQPW